MSSGGKREVINTRERAVSTDINRAQAFNKADLVWALAHMFDAFGSDTLTSGGLASLATDGTASPMRAQILSGLTAIPDVGSADLEILQGVMIGAAQTATYPADDSVYKIAFEPGITGLSMIANSSGSAQLQVVEVQFADSTLETLSRDIYNTTTGLFSASSVPKVVITKLIAQVRSMTLSGGFTPSAGWLPLMLAIVPDGATIWDNCPYIWDVRPLIEDKAQSFGRMLHSVVPHLNAGQNIFSIEFNTTRLNGRVEAINFDGRKIGGDLAYDTTVFYLDMTSSDLGPGTGGLTANRPYYMYLCTPYALPRWCRYTSVAAGFRVPGKLRGIPVITTVAPVPVTNLSSANVPAVLNFPGNFGTGVCVFAGMANNTPDFIKQGIGDDKSFQQVNNVDNVAGTSNADYSEWTLTGGTHYPANARAIYCSINIQFSAVAPNASQQDQIIQSSDRGGNLVTEIYRSKYISDVAFQLSMRVDVRVPIDFDYPANTVPTTVKVRSTYTGSASGYAVAPGVKTLTITGWEI